MSSPPGNGSVEISAPVIGSLRISGRDVLLAIVIAVVGSAAIGVQYIALTNFRDTIRADLSRALDLANAGKGERAEIVGLLKARTCTEVFLEAARQLQPEMRAQVERTWASLCLPKS